MGKSWNCVLNFCGNPEAMQVKSIAESSKQGEHSAILLAFIKLPFCIFLSGRFTQVLLYTKPSCNKP